MTRKLERILIAVDETPSSTTAIEQGLALAADEGAHVAPAISFVVAAASNYWWNRHWTFVHQKSHIGAQGARFFIVSLAAFAVNQLWLVLFIDLLHWRKIVSQAIAIILVTPLNFLGNKLWSFRK